MQWRMEMSNMVNQCKPKKAKINMRFNVCFLKGNSERMGIGVAFGFTKTNQFIFQAANLQTDWAFFAPGRAFFTPVSGCRVSDGTVCTAWVSF